MDLDVTTSQQERLLQLNGFDELKMTAILHNEFIQLQRKVSHDNHIKENTFQEGDYAMLYDSRFIYFKGKLMTRSLGPYLVEKCYENGYVQIRTIDEE